MDFFLPCNILPRACEITAPSVVGTAWLMYFLKLPSACFIWCPQCLGESKQLISIYCHYNRDYFRNEHHVWLTMRPHCGHWSVHLIYKTKILFFSCISHGITECLHLFTYFRCDCLVSVRVSGDKSVREGSLLLLINWALKYKMPKAVPYCLVCRFVQLI